MTQHPIILDVHNLSFSYTGVPVLEHVTFHVHEGDYLGIIGPNGGGKTTLLKIILGLLRPTTGTVHLFGKDKPTGIDRRGIAYVPQIPSEVAMEFPVSVEEMVESGRTPLLKGFGHLQAIDREAVTRALEATNLTSLRQANVGTLSGGQRQRVYLARALASNPKLLILDEPSVGVDAESQIDFFRLLKELNQKNRLTILLVSHDLENVSEQVQSILCVNRRLVAHGSPEDTMHSAAVHRAYAASHVHVHE